MRGGCWAVVAACGLGMSACGGDDDGDTPARTTRDAAPAARCTPAPGARGTLTIAPKYRPGERRRLTITKTREDGSAPARSATTEATLTVIAGGPRRARLRLRTAKTDFGQATAQLPAQARAELERLGGFDVEFRTDADGAFAAVVNMAAARAQVRRAADTLGRLIASHPSAAEVMQRLEPLLRSDAFIEQSVGDVAGVLLYAYGFELGDQPRTFETQLPNRLGGEPFPATARVRLVDRRDDDGCVVVELVTTPDIPSGSGSGVRLRNTVRYRWDPSSGWIVGVRGLSDMIANGRRRTETTLIDVR